jgi:hypothetical protein
VKVLYCIRSRSVKSMSVTRFSSALDIFCVVSFLFLADNS